MAVPQPIKPRRGAPQGQPVTQTAGATPAQRRDVPIYNITPETAGIAIRPGLRPRREKILLAGDTVSGKSFAWLRRAQQEYDRALESGKEAQKFYVINTDESMNVMLAEGEEFADLYFGAGGNVYPYIVYTWGQAASAIAAAAKEAQPGDWIVIDVVNHLYDWAQLVVAAANNKALFDHAASRQMNKRGFGGLETHEWQAVTIMFVSLIDTLRNARAHLIFVSHIAEMIDAPNRAERREFMVLFDQLGYKTRGAPKLPGFVDTIIVLYTIKQILRDERKERIGSKVHRHLTLLKERGTPAFEDMVYDRDAFDLLYEYRRNKSRQTTTNETDVEKARAFEAEERERIRSEQERQAQLADPDSGDDDDIDDDNDDERESMGGGSNVSDNADM